MVSALYPGSFDPVTRGHLDLVERALPLFDRLTVAVALNSSKTPTFTAEERVEMLREVLPRDDRLSVTTFSGLVVDFCREQGIGAVLRGVRTVSDFEYEYQMALTNRHLAPGIETVFVMPSVQFSYVSSSLIREIVRHGGDVTSFLPPPVERRLRHRLRPQN
ncbi:MAG: pantetheine-phosphate adenylyltransferase [Planctomycetes bacterium]|nr:pantetheine-phosphate adenylyltransferase [Planctomycetota bacterium]MBZ0153440.1 pantetheine-phosphate adenylyltransferase [Planctomycetota bacterium]MCC7399622.1 pantetheine-phosphate adenylyltransferase [Planctomycetota bacterium]